jgi:transcriptional regulator with XRE-family HTH domain
MPLRDLIEQAIEKAGNQLRLAEMMGVKQQDVSKWKTGKRYCTTPTRIELCKIADYDLKVALLEQVIEGLDPADEVQAEAGAMLQAVIAAFPNEGWRKR